MLHRRLESKEREIIELTKLSSDLKNELKTKELERKVEMEKVRELYEDALDDKVRHPELKVSTPAHTTTQAGVLMWVPGDAGDAGDHLEGARTEELPVGRAAAGGWRDSGPSGRAGWFVAIAGGGFCRRVFVSWL